VDYKRVLVAINAHDIVVAVVVHISDRHNFEALHVGVSDTRVHIVEIFRRSLPEELRMEISDLILSLSGSEQRLLMTVIKMLKLAVNRLR